MLTHWQMDIRPKRRHMGNTWMRRRHKEGSSRPPGSLSDQNHWPIFDKLWFH